MGIWHFSKVNFCTLVPKFDDQYPFDETCSRSVGWLQATALFVAVWAKWTPDSVTYSGRTSNKHESILVTLHTCRFQNWTCYSILVYCSYIYIESPHLTWIHNRWKRELSLLISHVAVRPSFLVGDISDILALTAKSNQITDHHGCDLRYVLAYLLDDVSRHQKKCSELDHDFGKRSKQLRCQSSDSLSCWFGREVPRMQWHHGTCNL